MSSSSLADAHTEVRMERIAYTWSIKRFNHLPQGVGERICSPWFYSRDRSEKWRFHFYPRGELDSSPEGVNYVALYLARDSLEKSEVEVYSEVKITKSNRILENSSFTIKYKSNDNSGSGKFLERSKLLTKKSTDDDQFEISSIIDIPMEVKTSKFDSTIFDSKKIKLNDDLRSLFEDPIFSDFTIIVGDQKFPTHRNILAKRSPVFAAMFKLNELEENRKKEVKIENMESDVIKGMLEFMYTDQVTDMKELASGLLEAADKYDLEQLRAMCEKTLYEGLNKENAAEVLQLADLHRADTLKKCVMKYIAEHTPEVVKSNNWKKTGWGPELLLELIDQLALPEAVNNDESQSSKA